MRFLTNCRKLLTGIVLLLICLMIYNNIYPQTTEVQPDSTEPQESLIWNDLPPAEEVPVSTTPRAFIEGHPHTLLVLSYQRCGSSFFGGLFSSHPEGIYFYEPLDGLYTAMYGIPEGWSVPADIMNWKNGTERTIPELEIKGIRNYLDDLFACRFDSMPKEFALHHFFFGRFQDGLNYGRCMHRANVTRAVTKKCHTHLRHTCSQRFGQDVSKHQICMDVFWNATENKPVESIDHSVAEPFLKYTQCMNGHRERSSHCTTKLQSVCVQAKFRSIKTVRATMDSVESLILTIPNIRVIHLIRDPRAVVLSRQKFDSSGRSLYAGGNMVKEAELFCRNLARDVTLRRSLEKKYQGVFMEVRYDKFVLDPLEYTEKIYNFMNLTLVQNVKDWVIKNTLEKKNSTSIANKWQTSLSYLQVKRISEVCKDYFQLVPHDWNFGAS